MIRVTDPVYFIHLLSVRQLHPGSQSLGRFDHLESGKLRARHAPHLDHLLRKGVKMHQILADLRLRNEISLPLNLVDIAPFLKQLEGETDRRPAHPVFQADLPLGIDLIAHVIQRFDFFLQDCIKLDIKRLIRSFIKSRRSFVHFCFPLPFAHSVKYYSRRYDRIERAGLDLWKRTYDK